MIVIDEMLLQRVADMHEILPCLLEEANKYTSYVFESYVMDGVLREVLVYMNMGIWRVL